MTLMSMQNSQLVLVEKQSPLREILTLRTKLKEGECSDDYLYYLIYVMVVGMFTLSLVDIGLKIMI